VLLAVAQGFRGIPLVSHPSMVCTSVHTVKLPVAVEAMPCASWS
jgi:hypothetical protein